MSTDIDHSSGPPVFVSPPMRMSAGERLGPALKRMALEQLAVVREGFTLPEDELLLDGRVHLARKAAKRTRALLRLVRAELGTEVFRNENAVIRDQSRRLSDMRIARVLVTTFDGFTPVDLPDVPMSGFRMIRNILVDHHASLAAALRADQDGLAAAKVAIDCSCRRIGAWIPPETYQQGMAALEPNIRRIYRQGRVAMRAAESESNAHGFHDWRKRVNYLRYQMEALSGGAQPPIRLLSESLHALSEILGDEHDLADLEDHLRDRADQVPEEYLEELFASANERRRLLQRTALDAGHELYAAKPGTFMTTLAESW